MAASLGFNSSHEAYYYQAADPLVAAAAAHSAAPLSFPELGAVRPSDYSPALSPGYFAAAGSEMSSFPTSYYYYNGAGAYDGAAARGVSGRAPAGRIGFRTRSEVEVMDDGFRWRKYGKKAVKSSPNLRNYYRCSVEGCGVKKRVERDRDDPRYVITSYDGVHNHPTPGSHGASREAAYSAPAPPTWTWSDLHAAAAHSSESSY
ncbi:WRKY transcription factor 28-like [Lolium rigidum]|uniref:WRKY transcription factor 28-like n=1 Tax=Lolium rigidum TaxID=89674 RepID=UPI001F5D0C7B|nr:WRKY transcription factor 28-like [Lolium rigidum]